MTTTTYLKTYAKAWGDRGVERVQVSVDRENVVRVYDDIAGHYTTCHSLSDSALRRIRELAQMKRASI